MKAGEQVGDIAVLEEPADMVLVLVHSVVTGTGVQRQEVQACTVAELGGLCTAAAPARGADETSAADARTVCDDQWAASCHHQSSPCDR